MATEGLMIGAIYFLVWEYIRHVRKLDHWETAYWAERRGRARVEAEMKKLTEVQLNTSDGFFVQPIAHIHSCFRQVITLSILYLTINLPLYHHYLYHYARIPSMLDRELGTAAAVPLLLPSSTGLPHAFDSSIHLTNSSSSLLSILHLFSFVFVTLQCVGTPRQGLLVPSSRCTLKLTTNMSGRYCE